MMLLINTLNSIMINLISSYIYEKIIIKRSRVMTTTIIITLERYLFLEYCTSLFIISTSSSGFAILFTSL